MYSRLFLASVVVLGLAIVFLNPCPPAEWPAARSEISAASAPLGPSSERTPAAGASTAPRIPVITSSQRAGNLPSSAMASGPAIAPSEAFVLPAGTQWITHLVKRNESLGGIVSRYLPDSIYMRRAELEMALRQANGLNGNGLKPGAQIRIPGIPLAPILDKPKPTPKDFVARGIYLTAYSAGSSHGLDLIRSWKEAGGNAVVFDIKDFDGEVHIPFRHAYAPTGNITIRNLPKFIHYLHSLQMHAIARIAVFRDEHLAQSHPELAVHSRATGKPWEENGKLVWTDPSNPDVQQYNLDLARAAASAGADEIQFDYVRFPAEGDQADARFAFQEDHPDWPRSRIISDFVARAQQMLHSQGVLFSIDVFGVMAWATRVDLDHTGQNIADLARCVDVMSPMIYPSHFFGFDGYRVPGDAPEHFISESMQRFEQATTGSGVVLRPWLQAFGWHTKTYSASYILTQVRVAQDQGGVGFLFWNARNDYSRPFQAMPAVQAAIQSSPPAARNSPPNAKAPTPQPRATETK
jgi:hypothetical protein